MTLKFRSINGEYMGERNIDKLRNENDDAVIEFMVWLFNSLGVSMPYTMCKSCIGRSNFCAKKCDYTDEEFMSAWLYSEKKRLY